MASIVLAFAGCVTTLKSIRSGPNAYMVMTPSDACGNRMPTESRAALEANAYCKSLGKIATITDSENQTLDIRFGHRVGMTFIFR